jgi:hypothetical protein
VTPTNLAFLSTLVDSAIAPLAGLVLIAAPGVTLSGCGDASSDTGNYDAGSDTAGRDGAAEGDKDSAGKNEAGDKDASNPIPDANQDSPSSACAGPHPTSCTAVMRTVANSALCTNLTVFYFEFGSSTNTLFSGTGGKHYAATNGDSSSPTYTCLNSDIGTFKNGCPESVDVTSRTQKVTWASASKWVYGAFAAETQQVSGGGPASVPTNQQPYMNFTSGYTNMTDNGKACSGSRTPDACLALSPLYSETVPANVGIFDYDSGHFENHAGTFGSLGMTTSGAAGTLTSSVTKGLGVTWASSFYTSPLMAGGIYGPIEDYVTFLRTIMTGDLAISKDMTYNAACTQGGASYTVSPSGKSMTPFTCDAGSSPLAPAKDYYSFGHWIEADAAYGGDYSFSSAGSYGVYPALTEDLSLYEVVSRDAQPGYYSGGQQGLNTLRCGTALRKAWLTGVEQ